ncbi:MAG: nicotinate (nicotinamide) nucleotide adenylyltransferase [Ardenticatenaceae bacterium]|nr:nicotinate (nicotinamide) nucleotide adenylyltransferase [Ardenticatenaceae bacterium]
MGGVGEADARNGRRRLGLFGGTFDPPHIGHLWLAETAREQLQLEAVLFLPTGSPPHKQNCQVTAVSHRLAMLQQAIHENPHFCIDMTDIERPLPHTTVTLLPQLKQLYADADLWWLIGSDSLRDLPTWNDPEQIIQQCRLGVLPRPAVDIDWETLETAVPGIKTAVDWLDGPQLHISSTIIRRWAYNGHSLRYLVGTAVADYIQTHQLYKPVNG